MEYTQETLDRTNGQLIKTSLGEWMTITELGERYGVGPKKVRAVLHHMGLLSPEKGRYRLSQSMAERGFGRRHDRPRSGYPFDVLSPLAQRCINEIWEETLADYEAEQRGDVDVINASNALEAFRADRQHEMVTQESVCWVLAHYPRLTFQQVADVVEVDRALVSRYAMRRARDLHYWKQWMHRVPGPLSELPPTL